MYSFLKSWFGLLRTRRIRAENESVSSTSPEDRADRHWAHDVRADLEGIAGSLPEGLLADLERVNEIVAQAPTYEFRSSELEEVAVIMLDAHDLDELARMMAKASSICGFSHANIFLLNHGSAVYFHNRVCTTFKPSWLAQYDRGGYQYKDPVVLRALTENEPFLFSDLKSSSPVVQEFWARAEEAGIGRNGCCFVFDREHNTRIGVSFTSMENAETVQKAFRRHRRDLLALGDVASEVFVEMSGVFRVEQSRLTDDELRFLKALIRATDTEEMTKLSHGPHFELMRSTICHKLGVSTVVQALSSVSRERWFDDLPFDGPEVAKSYPGTLVRPTYYLSTSSGRDCLPELISLQDDQQNRSSGD